MKNLARIIAIAIAMSAVFFIGCSNDVGGTLGNNTLLAVLLQQKSNGNITELKLNAISDDHTVSFGSRTIQSGSQFALLYNNAPYYAFYRK